MGQGLTRGMRAWAAWAREEQRTWDAFFGDTPIRDRCPDAIYAEMHHDAELAELPFDWQQQVYESARG